MKTITEMPVLMSLNKNEIAQLGQQQTPETLDIEKAGKSNCGISAGKMWRIHNQRRGLSIRQALR